MDETQHTGFSNLSHESDLRDFVPAAGVKQMEEYPVGLLQSMKMPGKHLQGREEPYDPVNPEAVDYAYRTKAKGYLHPSEVLKNLTDFYRICNGTNGVSFPHGTIASEMQAVMDQRLGKKPPTTPPAPITSSPAVPVSGSGTAGVASGGGAAPAQTGFDDYRSQALQQTYSMNREQRVCLHYRSTEGCRRGVECPYKHI